MSRAVWPLALALWNLAAAGTLLSAWVESRAIESVGPVQGARLDAPIDRPPTGPKHGPPQDGVYDLSWFVIPGYDPPELRADSSALDFDAFPEAVRAMNGTTVRIRGHVLSLKSTGVVTEFLLNRYPAGCCFGAVPTLDEWVLIHVPDGFDPGTGEQVVIVEGVLEVGEVHDEHGFATSLYRMRAESIEAQ